MLHPDKHPHASGQCQDYLTSMVKRFSGACDLVLQYLDEMLAGRVRSTRRKKRRALFPGGASIIPTVLVQHYLPGH
eukprot:12932454-Prorocentrum_lima.AAC.1